MKPTAPKIILACLCGISCGLLIATAIVKLNSPPDLAVSECVSGKTISLPANANPSNYQVWNGKNWNPATGEITWVPATDGTNQ